MRKSATRIGDPYGIRGYEMNIILREDGFLDNDGRLTERGKEFGKVRYENQYSYVSWQEEIVDELDLSKERIQNIRHDIEMRQKQAEEARLATMNNVEDDYNDIDYADDEHSSNNQSRSDLLVGIFLALGTVVTTLAINKARPRIKNWWENKKTSKIRETRKLK